MVDEVGVDTTLLGKHVTEQTAALKNISLLTGQTCDLLSVEDSYITLHTGSATLRARNVIIAGYAGINPLLTASGLKPLALKTEITEMALVQAPKPFHKAGITVMDGPFFSCMPYGKGAAHTLSHVRYTPHVSIGEANSAGPYELLADYKANAASRFPFMRNDAARYVPALRQSKYLGSFYEAKTIPQKHEIDDGRPILVREHTGHLGNLVEPSIISLLGSKLDSIYEWESLLAEKFS
jgi:glycine/D-amino acid oxidase-like deaminating enzyme